MSKVAIWIIAWFIIMAFAGTLSFVYTGEWTMICWLFSILQTWFRDALRAALMAKFELMRVPVVIMTVVPVVWMAWASAAEPICGGISSFLKMFAGRFWPLISLMFAKFK